MLASSDSATACIQKFTLYLLLLPVLQVIHSLDDAATSVSSLIVDGLALIVASCFLKIDMPIIGCIQLCAAASLRSILPQGFPAVQPLLLAILFPLNRVHRSLGSAVAIVLLCATTDTVLILTTLLYFGSLYLGLQSFRRGEGRGWWLVMSGVCMLMIALMFPKRTGWDASESWSRSPRMLFAVMIQVAIFQVTVLLRTVSSPEVTLGISSISTSLVVFLTGVISWARGGESSFSTSGIIIGACVLLHLVHLRRCVGRLDYLGVRNQDTSVGGAAGGFLRWGIELSMKQIHLEGGYTVCLAFYFDVIRLAVSEPFYWVATAVCAIGTLLAPQDFRFFLHKVIQPPDVQVGCCLFVGPSHPPSPAFFQCNMGIIDSLGPDWVATNKESVAIMSAWAEEHASPSPAGTNGFCGNLVAEFPIFDPNLRRYERLLTSYFASQVRQCNLSAWTSTQAAADWAGTSSPHRRIVAMQATPADAGGFSSFSGLLVSMVPATPLRYGVRCSKCKLCDYTFPSSRTCRACNIDLPPHPLF